MRRSLLVSFPRLASSHCRRTRRNTTWHSFGRGAAIDGAAIFASASIQIGRRTVSRQGAELAPAHGVDLVNSGVSRSGERGYTSGIDSCASRVRACEQVGAADGAQVAPPRALGI